LLPYPQGSVLSTLLCSLFLADLEARHLRPLLPAPRPDASQTASPASSEGGGSAASGGRASVGGGSIAGGSEL